MEAETVSSSPVVEEAARLETQEFQAAQINYLTSRVLELRVQVLNLEQRVEELQLELVGREAVPLSE